MALVPCQVLRVAILLSYCSILCNYKAIEMPSHQTYGGSWKFLTFIDLYPEDRWLSPGPSSHLIEQQCWSCLDRKPYWVDWLVNEDWLCQLCYVADIFHLLNELNLQP
ncbi:androgen-induced gene 1 protein isoform X3 [Callithrix jacchus]|uniref:androgen-induced gene 1 protein isoform X3 n=1 Tax=Callithrix jacchus TaxID=9483 RepID=UPI00159E7C44|nr:androgen-induced gene 1 protein isoform X3 [Callithrix jacchus]